MKRKHRLIQYDDDAEIEHLVESDGSDDIHYEEAPIQVDSVEEDVAAHSSTAVLNFERGDMGISALLNFRMRPPLEDMNYDSSRSFEFQLNEIDYYHDYGAGEAIIRIYGITRLGYSVTVNVHGFHPYFIIRWPYEMSDETRVNEFIHELENALQKQDRKLNGCAVRQYTLCKGIDTRGYMESCDCYMIIYMKFPNLVRKARTIIESDDWRYADAICDTYESDIDFTLRYMCDCDFTGECTLQVPAGCYSIVPFTGTSCTTDLEITVPDYRVIRRAEDQIDVSRKVIFSYDAEMLCEAGNFPDPQNNPVITIAVRLRVLGVKDSYKHICMTLHSSGDITARHPDAIVHCYDSEVDMLLAFRALMLISDADILTGYNVDDFDMPYFIERADVLKHKDERAANFAYLGRLLNQRSVVRDSRKSDRAHGVRQNKEINIAGRVQFDLLKVLLKEFKLRSYTLNSVSQKFLGNQKEDMSYQLIPIKFKTEKGRTELASYCMKDAILPDHLLEKLRSLLKYIQKARVPGVTIQSLLKRGMGFQCKSKLYRKFHQQVPRVFIYVRTELQRELDRHDEKYGGAYVETPVKGYHTSPIPTLDFSSLYPSVMIAWNMCFTTKISVAYARERGWKRASLHGDGSDGDYFQIPNTHNDENVRQFIELFHAGKNLEPLFEDSNACFVTPKHKEGVVPSILKEFLTKRKAVKREMAEHGELKERLRDYAEDIVKTKDQLLEKLHNYTKEVEKLKAALQDEARPDVLKLKRELDRLQWKIETLQHDVSLPQDQRNSASEQALNKAETEAFLEILTDLFQLEIKLSGNSLYGQFGDKTSFMYCRAVASAVTGMGKFMILLTKFTLQKVFCKANGYPMDAKVVYGDSVSADTPVIIRHKGCISICEVSRLPIASAWMSGIEDKEVAAPEAGLEVWAHNRFTKVKTVIRHKVQKPLVYVKTTAGCVTVTSDHSLIRNDGSIVRPHQLSLLDQLLTTVLPPVDHNNMEKDELMWLWGLFFRSGFQYSSCWGIKHHAQLLQDVEKMLLGRYPGIVLSYDSHSNMGTMHTLMCEADDAASIEFRRQWSTLFYHECLPHGAANKVPDEVWMASVASQELFLKGCMDSCECSNELFEYSQLRAASLYFLATRLGYEVDVDAVHSRHRQRNPAAFLIRIGRKRLNRLYKPETIFARVEQQLAYIVLAHKTADVCYVSPPLSVSANDFVYDIETECHVFAAGVGQLVVHNTDSVFVKLEGVDMERARQLAMEMSAYASKLWPPPHKLEAEKIYNPLLLVKKKKYAGLKYLMDPETGGLQPPKVDSSGLETVRRDNCKFSTEVLDRVLHILMTAGDGLGVQRAIEFIQKQVSALLRGEINLYKLIISKQLRKDKYANPTVHSVLAERMGKKAGNRIAYLIVKRHQGAKNYLCGEDPEVVFRTNAPIDFDWYMKKQLMEPIIRLFAPILVPNMDMDRKDDVKSIRQAVIRRIFMGEHMRQRKITINRQNLGRDSVFAVVPQCKFCKMSLRDDENQYCNSCKEKHSERLTGELRQKLQQLSLDSLEQWKRCQKCMGVTQATHIVCDQNDCENYWMRRKTSIELAQVSDALLTLYEHGT